MPQNVEGICTSPHSGEFSQRQRFFLKWRFTSALSVFCTLLSWPRSALFRFYRISITCCNDQWRCGWNCGSGFVGCCSYLQKVL